METTSAVLFFPLLLPIWQQRPLIQDDLYPEPYPVAISQKLLDFEAHNLPNTSLLTRQRILTALGATHNPAAAEFLLQWLRRETEPSVQETILAQLQRFPPPPAAAESAIRKFLFAPTPRVQLAAVRLYIRLSNADSALLLKIAQTSKNPLVRRTAWTGLIPRFQTIPRDQLLSAIDDPDPLIRSAAGVCLIQKLPVFSRAIFQKIAADSEPIVRVRCLEACGHSSVSAAVARELCRLLAGDSNPAVRAEIPNIAARRANASLLPILSRFVRDPDSEVRRRTAAALNHFPRRACLDLVATLLADPAEPVRREAARTLAVFKHSGLAVATKIISLLDSPSPGIRGTAYFALALCAEKQTGEKLTLQLEVEKDHPHTLAYLISALGQLHIRRAAAAVADYAANPSCEVRSAVAETLGLIGNRQIYSTLEKLAGDRERRVRHAAFLGIGRGANGEFSPICTHILQRVQANDYITGDDRADACWAAARLIPVDQRLVHRLVIQATTPVIPMPGMKMFDQDTVLVSAQFALVSMALRNPAIRPAAEKVLKVYSRTFTQAELRKVCPTTMVPTPAFRDFARQARALLEHRTIKPGRRPPATPKLPLMPVTNAE